MADIVPAGSAAEYAAQIADLRRRIAALETVRSTAKATVAGGQLRIADDNNATVASFGEFELTDSDGNPVTRHGVQVIDPDTGLVVLRSTLEDGATAPKHEVSWTPFAELFQSTISPTFEPLWITRSTLWPSSGVWIASLVTITGTASWETRCKIGSTSIGTVYTDVVSGSGSENVIWQVDLLALGFDLNDDLGVRFDLEARRTSGSGTVFVELPYPVLAHDATTEPATPGGL